VTNAIQVKRLHLTNLMAHIVSGLRAGDCHRNMLQIRYYSGRPGICCSAGGHSEPLACGPPPAFPDELAERQSRIAIHHELHVMVRRIKPAKGIHSLGILRQVVPCVPAVFCDIQSTGKRDSIIDDDDLLMMRRTHGMVTVETEMDPSVTAPGMAIKWNDFAIGRIDHREIP